MGVDIYDHQFVRAFSQLIIAMAVVLATFSMGYLGAKLYHEDTKEVHPPKRWNPHQYWILAIASGVAHGSIGISLIKDIGPQSRLLTWSTWSLVFPQNAFLFRHEQEVWGAMFLLVSITAFLSLFYGMRMLRWSFGIGAVLMLVWAVSLGALWYLIEPQPTMFLFLYFSGLKLFVIRTSLAEKKLEDLVGAIHHAAHETHVEIERLVTEDAADSR